MELSFYQDGFSPMPIKFRCQHCHQLLGISQTKAGESVDCPTCGRAVRVPTLDGKSSPAPVPKMNLQDSSLLNALDALAGLGMGAEAPKKPPARVAAAEKVEAFASTDSEEPSEPGTPATKEEFQEAEDPRELVPQPLPEPVELPPLETPVALEEPITPRGRGRAEIIKPTVTSSPTSRDPLIALSTLADRPASPKNQSSAPAASNTSLSTLLFVSGLSFLAGFLVHAQFFSKDTTHPEEAPKNQEALRENPDGKKSNDNLTSEAVPKAAVEGRITYRTNEGNSKPDAGAPVILLPTSRSSSVKLPITGFRPADHQDDRDIARASVRALGGDVCQVDEDGRFTAELEQPGNYHVFVMSHFQQRAEDDVRLSDSVKTVLLDYFDRPEQLPGRRRYYLGYVYYRGESTEIWDYSFERL